MKEYKLSEILTIKNGRDYKNLKNGLYPVYGSGGLMCTVDNYLYNRKNEMCRVGKRNAMVLVENEM